MYAAASAGSTPRLSGGQEGLARQGLRLGELFAQHYEVHALAVAARGTEAPGLEYARYVPVTDRLGREAAHGAAALQREQEPVRAELAQLQRVVQPREVVAGHVHGSRRTYGVAVAALYAAVGQRLRAAFDQLYVI